MRDGLIFLLFFFNIDAVLFNFDKLGEVASKRIPNSNLDPHTWKTPRIFTSCARWKGEAWCPYRHYDKLIVSFSFR